jgi:predicted RNase H-like nuclease (RuvC/YqgF family)
MAGEQTDDVITQLFQNIIPKEEPVDAGVESPDELGEILMGDDTVTKEEKRKQQRKLAAQKHRRGIRELRERNVQLTRDIEDLKQEIDRLKTKIICLQETKHEKKFTLIPFK